MSLYVTLTSHGAKFVDGDIINTQNDFRIDLKSPLSFPANRYEVALVEMSFKSFWLVDLGRFTIWKSDPRDKVKTFNSFATFDHHIFVHDGIKLEELCKLLTFKLQSKGVSFKYLGDNFIDIELESLDSFDIIGHFATLLHKEKDYLNEIQQIPNQDEFMMESFTKRINFDQKHNKCFVNLNMISYIENLFVYTNIIEDIHISEEKKKLLRIVPVNHSNDFFNNVIFSNPHYVPVENDFIERIRMSVLDSRGDKIKFIDMFSNVIYKLHFRHKKYQYK